MAFVVIYDACVLYPAPLRDLLLRIALAGVVRARWSDEILDECFRNVAANRSDLSAEALARTRRLMCEAVPDCLVTNYARLADGVVLPDPNDQHVLAAAIRSNAQVIVTFNLNDFPDATLAPFGIKAKHPDDFALEHHWTRAWSNCNGCVATGSSAHVTTRVARCAARSTAHLWVGAVSCAAPNSLRRIALVSRAIQRARAR